MPDLGQYSGPVLSAYAVSTVLIVVVTALSLWRAAKVKKQLAKIEKRHKDNG